MQALVLRGTALTVEEWPRPTPASGEVLVRVLAAGICGSDVHAATHLEAMMEETGPTSWYAEADLVNPGPSTESQLAEEFARLEGDEEIEKELAKLKSAVEQKTAALPQD